MAKHKTSIKAELAETAVSVLRLARSRKFQYVILAVLVFAAGKAFEVDVAWLLGLLGLNVAGHTASDLRHGGRD